MGAAALAAPWPLSSRGEAQRDASRSPQKPNFVFLLVDDLGWSHVECFGNTVHETPNVDRLTDEAVDLLDAFGEERQNPFMLFLSYYTVHTPIQSRPDDKKHFEQKMAHHADPHWTNSTYAGMVRALDRSVGRILDKLEALFWHYPHYHGSGVTPCSAVRVGDHKLSLARGGRRLHSRSPHRNGPVTGRTPRSGILPRVFQIRRKFSPIHFDTSLAIKQRHG